jgi:hypothetical protein
MRVRWLLVPSFLLFLLASVGLHFVPQAAAQSSTPPLSDSSVRGGSGDYNLVVVGQLGGPVNVVDVQGNYAYISVGLRLVVLDISDPSSPAVIGEESSDVSQAQLASAGGDPRRITYLTVEGNYVYMVEADGRGLRIIDVSNPRAPSEVNALPIEGAVAVVGNYAYLSGDGGLHIVDVSDPSATKEVGFYPQFARHIIVEGAYAYLSSGREIHILDVSNPAAPQRIGGYSASVTVEDLAVQGDHLYFVEHGRRDGEEIIGGYLRILDVTDRAAPVEVGFSKTPEFPNHVAVSGNYVYVSEWDDLRVFDMANRAAPREIAVHSQQHSSELVVADSSLYLVQGGGLDIFDVSEPTELQQMGTYRTLYSGPELAIGGDYACAVSDDLQPGIHIVDISDRARPRQTAFYETPTHPTWMTPELTPLGNYLYVVLGGNTHILDVSNPASPQEVAVHPEPLSGIVAGDHLFVFKGFALSIYDVSAATAPLKVGTYEIPYGPQDFAIVENRAYLLTSEALHIVDISNPAAPTRLGLYIPSDSFLGNDIAASGNYVYIRGNIETHDYLHAIDVSDPSNPTLLWEDGYFSHKRDLEITENHLYFLHGRGIWSSGLAIYDVSRLEGPEPILTTAIQITEEMVVEEDYFYTLGENGLYIRQLQPAAPSAVTLGTFNMSSRSVAVPLIVAVVSSVMVAWWAARLRTASAK